MDFLSSHIIVFITNVTVTVSCTEKIGWKCLCISFILMMTNDTHLLTSD